MGEFRTIEGSGNNQSGGETGSQLLRLFPNALEDGISVPRGGEFDSSTLPNPRTISNRISAQTESVTNVFGISSWLFQWGQLLDHDLSLNQVNEEDEPEPEDFTPIPIPQTDPNDPFVSPNSTGDRIVYNANLTGNN